MVRHATIAPERPARALGAYLGLAIGDALGSTVEFMTAGEIRARHGEHRDLIGGGWLRLPAGAVTDDTEMALAMGEAIVAAAGWDLAGIARRWGDWLRARPVDVGNTCRRGLTRYLNDGSLATPPADGDAGNGGLMRVLPAILYAARDRARLRQYVLEQAHVTHHHPLADAATVAFAEMLADLLASPPDAPPDPVDRQKRHWQQLRRRADDLVATHRAFAFDRYRGVASGYVVDTVQTVLHAFFTTDSLEACLIRTVNYGGDADTTGAIAGMLAGAFYGAAAIPPRWRRRLDPAVAAAVAAQTEALLALALPAPHAPP